MKKFVISILVLSMLLVACSAGGAGESTPAEGATGKRVEVAGGAYSDISVAELQAMFENKDFLFVNVHIPFEGDIHDTDLSVAYDEISQHLDQLPEDKNAKIVLYCRSGRMSSIAAEELVKAGYTDVYNLAGGFNAWEAAGLPVEGR